MTGPCAHVDATTPRPAPRTDGCEDCLAGGGTWVNRRMCLTCGHVGCCDSSPNRHATAHHRETGHPVITSIEPGQSWSWCYVDGDYVEA